MSDGVESVLASYERVMTELERIGREAFLWLERNDPALAALALEVFETKSLVGEWLLESNVCFDHRKPLEVLRDGSAELIKNHLLKARFGVSP